MSPTAPTSTRGSRGSAGRAATASSYGASAQGLAPPPRARPMTARIVGRRRRRLLVLVVVVAVLATAAWMATRSPLLDIDHLEVRGTERVTPDEVLAAAGIEQGDPIVWLDLSRARTRIETMPWVRSARVEREWPDTVRVTVVERRPVAWADAGNGTAVVVDPTGMVVSVDPAPPAGLPQLLGVTVTASVGTSLTTPEVARVAGALDVFSQAATRSIGIEGGRVTLVTGAGQEIRLGRATRIVDKVRAGFAVLAAPEAAGKQYVDVSAPATPVAG